MALRPAERRGGKGSEMVEGEAIGRSYWEARAGRCELGGASTARGVKGTVAMRPCNQKWAYACPPPQVSRVCHSKQHRFRLAFKAGLYLAIVCPAPTTPDLQAKTGPPPSP